MVFEKIAAMLAEKLECDAAETKWTQNSAHWASTLWMLWSF